MDKRIKILIIEDDENIRKLIADVLTFEGYLVFTFSSVEEVGNVISLMEVDLIILDIMLPGKSGLDFVEDIQSKETLNTIPIILLTARSSLDDIRAGMLLGADDYIPKPFKIEDLLESVKLRLKKSNKSLTKRNPSIDHISTVQLKGIIIDNIKFIEAKNQYSVIYFDDNTRKILSKSLRFWEKNLEESQFIRINRGIIINIDKIENFQQNSSTSLQIKLKGIDKFFSVSRRRRKKVISLLTNDNR